MSKSEFKLVYDGPEMSSGTMDVFTLAPALLSAGKLISRSNELLNGANSSALVLVEAEFRKGSFGVTLQVLQDLKEHAEVLLPSLGMLNAAGLVEAVFGAIEKSETVVSGALKLFKLVKGEKPETVVPNQQTKLTAINFGSGTINQFIVSPEVARLYQDEEIRSLIAKLAMPIKAEGITSLEIRAKDKTIETLTETDLPSSTIFYEYVDVPSEVPAPKRDLLVRIVKPNFDGGRWSFSDGASKFGAIVEDKDFQQRVSRREIGFFQGDTLRISLRTSQHVDANNKLVTENIVEKVHEVITAPGQSRLTTTKN